MASRKLSYDQIAERNLFNPLKKELEELNDLLNKTGDNLREQVKEAGKLAKQTPLKGYEDAEKVEKAVENTTKAVKELDKIEKQRIQLQQRLLDLEDDRVKANEQLKVEIQAKTRAMKQEATLAASTTDKYQKMNVRLGQLRKQYKQQALDFGRNSRGAKELREEIIQLAEVLELLDRDVKQQTREIGRYENALQKLGQVTGITKLTNGVNKLNNALKALAAATIIFQALKFIGQAIGQNSVAAGGLQKAIGAVTIAFQTFVNRTVTAIQNLQGLWGSLSSRIELAGKRIKLAALEIAAFGRSTPEIRALKDEINALNTQLSTQPNYLQQITGAYKGMGAEIAALVKRNNTLIDTQIRMQLQAARLIREIGGLADELARLGAEADDDTLSLGRMQAASEALLQVQTKMLEKRIELARMEELIAREQAAINKANVDLQRASAEATAARLEAEAELLAFRFENAAKTRKILSDQLEVELDILFDVSDRRKTIAEQSVNDERISLETRAKMVRETMTDIEGSYVEINDKINEFLRASFESRKATYEAEGLAFDEAFTPIDLESLISETDTKKFNERLNEISEDANVREAIRNRIREFYVERIQAIADLETAQRDLNEKTAEYETILADVGLQENALAALQKDNADAAEVIAILEEQRLEKQIALLRAQILVAEEGSTERIKLQQELNNTLLGLEEKRLAEENAKREEAAAKEEERMAKREERAQEMFQMLSGMADNYFQKQQEQAQAEIDASREREDQLREAAERGIQDARENLAIQAQQTAEAERQKALSIRRQKLAELALAAVEVYSAKVAAGDRNPLPSTIAEISLLRAFVEGLPAFWEGAERVGDEIPATMPGRDGHIIRVDGGERVMPSALNAMIPRTMTNETLARIAAGKEAAVRAGGHEFARLEKGLQQVRQAIEKQPIYQGMDWDRQREALTFVVDRKGRRERKHRRVGGLFGG